MEIEVKEPSLVEDGKYRGTFSRIEYRTEPFDYTDIVVEHYTDIFVKLKFTFAQFEAMMALTRAESIVRFRRWINERGVIVGGQVERYLPRPETTSKRRALANAIRMEMRHGGI